MLHHNVIDLGWGEVGPTDKWAPGVGSWENNNGWSIGVEHEL